MSTRIIFDIETNGLLDQLDRVHCLVFKNPDTGDAYTCTDDPDYESPRENYWKLDIKSGLEYLADLPDDTIFIGHNIIKFDDPAIQKVYPWFGPMRHMFDTLVASRLLWTDLKNSDLKLRSKNPDFPGKRIGSHALEAWGYRLGAMKGDYSQVRTAAGKDKGYKANSPEMLDYVWGRWNPDMQEYCETDVEVTERLLKEIEDKGGAGYTKEAMDLEHRVAQIMWKSEQHGFTFDTKAADKLVASLMEARSQIEDELQVTFKPWWKPLGTVTPKRTVVPRKDLTKAGTWKDAPYTKIEREVFNPGSRDHIAARLQAIHGWKPLEFTESGKPKIDEDVLSGLKYPEAQLLVRYLTVQKRLGQVAEGNKAWLKMVNAEGRVDAEYTTGGAVTGRATHSNPNIGQVPKVKSGKDGILYGEAGGWGAECRSLFGPSKGKVLVGVDLSGLELRMLGHYMARWDKGAYIKTLLEGDIHTVNQKAAGLPSRDTAKTFIYGFLYGAGDGKIGSIVGKGRKTGGILRKRFLTRLPALGRLVKMVKSKVEAQRFLKGLDGRHLHIRSAHSALNTLLQSAGAILAKVWIVLFYDALVEAGLADDAKILAWVHDELQIECSPENAQQVAALAIEAAVKAGEHFNLRCPTAAEAKIGTNWKETH